MKLQAYICKKETSLQSGDVETLKGKWTMSVLKNTEWRIN
jgi:hypothetical protein